MNIEKLYISNWKIVKIQFRKYLKIIAKKILIKINRFKKNNLNYQKEIKAIKKVMKF